MLALGTVFLSHSAVGGLNVVFLCATHHTTCPPEVQEEKAWAGVCVLLSWPEDLKWLIYISADPPPHRPICLLPYRDLEWPSVLPETPQRTPIVNCTLKRRLTGKIEPDTKAGGFLISLSRHRNL